ncbi:C40 family peptidase [Dysgonomonas sp. 520]|uniref:C40 family peptidase n=1 Tax=Dysgonomonas sp. 520 TaxID=2302931 RepID=UPI0013D18D9C|nr:C40 family peptidase [Dysgonomonas sp. 520]NDW10107.1 NlpC/P60 family protein [Dysgonomonas sp. 520]
MNTPKKFFFTLTILIVSICSTLSAQKKQGMAETPPAIESKKTKELSNRLGFEICESDTTHMPLYETAADWLDVKYTWGGNSRKEGVDCSGFTRVLYNMLFGKEIDHNSNSLSKSVPVKISSPEKLKPGDMVFFATSKKHSKINHVGIYLKDGFFVHASSARKKVLVSTLFEGFYKKAWRMGGRYN